MERTRAVLVLQVGMNAGNVALSVLFVLGLGWGVPGVAAATLISEWAGLVLGLLALPGGLRRRRSGATGRGCSTRRGCGGWRRSTATS